MPACHVSCPVCARPTTVTLQGRVWAHGAPCCPGWGRLARRGRYWADRHRGRHVTTLPDIDDWQTAAA